MRFAGSANPRLLEELWKSSAGFFLLFLGLYTATLKAGDFFFYDLHDFILGRDFLNLWLTGKLALSDNPAQYYDATHYMQQMRALTGDAFQENSLSYPPTQFLFSVPFGLLPYPLAYAAWLLLNLTVFFAATRRLLEPSLRGVLLVSPVALIWLICGQSSLITAGLMLAALRLLPHAPYRAGICIGLLLIKPQLAILFPLYLLLTRQWHAFMAAALTVLLIVGVTLLWLGPDPWVAYYDIGISAQMEVFTHTTDMVASLTPTLYNDLRLIGVDADTSIAIQMAQGLLAAVALAFGLKHCHCAEARMLLFITASYLATFYIMSYDLIAFTAALILYAHRQQLQKHGTWLFAACYWLPLIDFFLNAYGVPGASLLPLVLLCWLLMNGRQHLRFEQLGAKEPA